MDRNLFYWRNPVMRQIRKILTAVVFAAIMTIITGSAVFAAAAKIGNSKYDTLQEAFSAVRNGQTITLLKNVTFDGDSGSMHLNIDGKCTFDLAKHTITIRPGRSANISIADGTLVLKNGTIRRTGKTGSTFILDGGGTLNIKSGSYSGGITCRQGTILIEGGTFTQPSANNAPLINILKGSATIRGGVFNLSKSSYPLIRNRASLTIMGGKFNYLPTLNDEDTDTFKPELDNGSVVCTTGSAAKTVVAGGTFTSKALCFLAESKGTLEIRKGSFTSTGGGVVGTMAAKSVVIRGGTFKATGEEGVHGVVYNNDGPCTITGGNFSSKWTLLENDYCAETGNGTMKVTGGTFKSSLADPVPALVLNCARGTITLTGGTFTDKNTYGYWKGDGRIVVSKNSIFKNTKGEKKGDLWE